MGELLCSHRSPKGCHGRHSSCLLLRHRSDTAPQEIPGPPPARCQTLTVSGEARPVASPQGSDSEHSAQPQPLSACPARATAWHRESFLEDYQAPKSGFQKPGGNGDPTEPLPSQELWIGWLAWKSALGEL